MNKMVRSWLMIVFSAFAMACGGFDDTTNINGVVWTYSISDGSVSIANQCIPSSTTGAITIPSELGGCPVTNIGNYAFSGCSGLTSVTIPEGVTTIGFDAFRYCSGLTSVMIPSSVKYIDDAVSFGFGSFMGCSGLTSVTIPLWFKLSEVFPDAYTAIENVYVPKGADYAMPDALVECTSLTNVTFLGDAPEVGLMAGTPKNLVVTVPNDSKGWSDNGSQELPSTWNGRRIQRADGTTGDGGTSGGATSAMLTVTNVVIHYVVNSVQPEKVIPASADTGFINVITEVKSGGAVSVPVTWMVNYPNYVSKFGNDFTKSLMKSTGKKDGAGNAMCVWQDYVAGTDPTDAGDVFTASITIVDGKVKISYSPELTADETAKRKYTTWGKASLLDADWIEVPAGNEGKYNFFKVTVEMR